MNFINKLNEAVTEYLTKRLLSAGCCVIRRKSIDIELCARLLNSKYLVNKRYLGVLKRNQIFSEEQYQ